MRHITFISNLGLRPALMLLAILLITGTGWAATSVTNTNDAGAGSLRAVVANAAAGDTVDFNLAGCPCTITLTTGQIVIDKSLTITGLGADALTISGNNTSRIFNISASDSVNNRYLTVNISGLTLTNGNASNAGGAILNLGTLNLSHSTVSDSRASSVPSKGGGIYNGGTLNLTNSTISGNTAIDGGGIYNGSILYATNSTISGNTANYGYGGGIYLSNFTFYAYLYNCTIAGNGSNGLLGAGMHRVSSFFHTTQIFVRNTIIAGNSGSPSAPDVWGNYSSEGNNLVGVGNGSSGFTQTTDQIGTSAAPLNPLLGPLQNNGGPTLTHALLTGSPAIDKGTFARDPATFVTITQDQRGSVRPADSLEVPNPENGNGSDIGAFELEYYSGDPTPPVITPNISGTLGSNGWYTSDVQVSWTVTDDESAVTIHNGCNTTTFSTDDVGTSIPCTASSRGGTSFRGVTISRDATPPSLAPAVAPNPVSLNGTATATPNASDNLSGIASQSCGTVDTSTVGSHSVACTATDSAGNTAVANADYEVASVLNFNGFFQPIENLPLLNAATGGSAIPVKFSLNGDQGLAIFATGYPASSPIPCNATQPGTLIEGTITAGGSSLSYDSVSDQYSYVWKTERSWRGNCRMLIVRFTDGSEHYAKFRFR